MTVPPLVLVGPRGGYQGLERTLVASLLEKSGPFIEVDISPEGPESSATIARIVARIEVAVRRMVAEGFDDPPALVGYSVGAQAAAKFAAGNPGVVGSLTLVAAWNTAPEKMREVQELYRAFRALGSAGDAKLDELALRSAKLVLSSARCWSSEMSSQQARRASFEIESALGMIDHADLELIAGQIAEPVLIIGCELDEFATVQQSRILFGAVSNARYAEVTCGHSASVERPAEVVALIESFVRNPQFHAAGTRLSKLRP